MKIRWKSLLICLAIPLAVCGLSAFLTKDAMKEFSQLLQPPLSPPAWGFPVVWTVLFILMGLATYLVVTAQGRPGTRLSALWAYAAQRLANFVWPLLFFRGKLWLPAFFWLLLLCTMVVGTLVLFGRIRPMAGVLMVPYLAWVSFAGYLNFGIYLLN